jgi:hypothetical protein
MTPTIDVDYVHRFVPAHPNSAHLVTLMLWHGTGGDENSLLISWKSTLPGGRSPRATGQGSGEWHASSLLEDCLNLDRRPKGNPPGSAGRRLA